MTRPRGTERRAGAPFLKIDLAEAFDRLKGEEAWKARPRNAVTLVKDEGLTAILVGLRKDATIDRHRANGPITIHVLGGALRLSIGGGTVALGPGQVLSLKANVEHDVRADEESAFLLTMGSEPSHPAVSPS
jgi:quercetin dioxygenase-like cupin family protein